MTEIKVCIKSDDLNVSEKYLEHEEGITLSSEDPILKARVHETLSKINPAPIDPEIILKIQHVWNTTPKFEAL